MSVVPAVLVAEAGGFEAWRQPSLHIENLLHNCIREKKKDYPLRCVYSAYTPERGIAFRILYSKIVKRWYKIVTS